jgi:sorting nexin-1/2
MGTDFIEERRRALQVFVNRVAAHPVLKASRELQRFLESNEDEFAFEVARSTAVSEILFGAAAVKARVLCR